MKIVHICLCGAMTDGFNYQENVITKYHKKMGNDVTIIASQWIWNSDGKLKRTYKTDYINEDGVKMVRLSIKHGTVNSRLKTYPDLYGAVEKERPDILFIHDCQFLDIRKLALYAKRHPNVKVYVDNHVDYSNGAHGWFSRNLLHKGLWRFCVKKIEPYVTKFYGVLPARVDFLKEMYDLPANKCELLVMGADDELVEKAANPKIMKETRISLGIHGNDFLIITGGKIDEWKTQTLLLMEAIQNISAERVRLIVFGSVSDNLKEKVNALVDDVKIQYVGWLSSEESYNLFGAADLVVFPGRHSVYWEQVAGQGIPMIVKDWPGTHHIDLGGNVLFLEQDKAQEIQGKIQELLDSPSKYELMKYNAQKKRMRFSYRDIAKRSIE
jgi:1,2-diacylglycerol 3-alpha-glucosyltransferase